MPHRLASQARRDLEEIWHYLAVETGNQSVADKTVDLIVDRFQLLSKWPRLGRGRDDLRRGLRSFVVGNYVIFYRIARAGVIIQRVLHSRRDINRVLQR